MQQRARPLSFTLHFMTDSEHAAANAEQLRLLREALGEALGDVLAPVLKDDAASRDAAPATPTSEETLRVPEYL